MKKEVLKCGYCNEEIKQCDECGKEFKAHHNIICLGAGMRHFCSKKCLDKFLKLSAIQTKTYYAKHLKDVLKEWHQEA